MSKVHEHPQHGRKAGQWAKDQADRLSRRNVVLAAILFIAMGIVIGWSFATFHFTAAVFIFAFGMGLLYLITIPVERHLDRQSRDRIKYMRGAQAEAFVAWYLQTLPDSYYVFHNLPCAEGGDIDHVVVGPSGLFVLSTKSHRGHVTRTPSGSIRLNGQPTDDLFEEAFRLAIWVKNRLKSVLGDQVPWVQPVLCLPHIHSDLPPTEGKVWLLTEQTLLETLESGKVKSKLPAKRAQLVAEELKKIV